MQIIKWKISKPKAKVVSLRGVVGVSINQTNYQLLSIMMKFQLKIIKTYQVQSSSQVLILIEKFHKTIFLNLRLMNFKLIGIVWYSVVEKIRFLLTLLLLKLILFTIVQNISLKNKLSKRQTRRNVPYQIKLQKLQVKLEQVKELHHQQVIYTNKNICMH